MPDYDVGSPADPMLGQQVEGYRILRVVGQGGMGVVYEAVHDEIRQRAAVKVLFPEFSTDVDAVSRFVAEARAASTVRHGGLVKIFYSGRLEDGTAYIMMEFLAGESIEERLRRLSKEGKRLELAAVTRIGQQIASALSSVHEAGIIHRDLKPANLILVAEPELAGGERIKVVDFGIAKFDRSTTEISKTTVGRFLGTALYASPEQCQMAGQVGPKADVYSLGIVLYEMIAGKPPFSAAQPGMVIGMHLFMQPAPLWEVARDVPESLHQLIHEMLAKVPDQRPSMNEVLHRLAGVKNEGPRLLWRLRRDGRALVVAAGVVVAASAGTFYWLSHAPHVEPRSAGPAAGRSMGSALVPSAGPALVSAAVVPGPAGPVAAGPPPDLGSPASLTSLNPSVAVDLIPEPGPKKLLRGKATHRDLRQRQRPDQQRATTAADLKPAGAVASPAGSPPPPAVPPAPAIKSPKPEPVESTHTKPTKTTTDDGILR